MTTGLLAFIAAWNEFLFALSFIQTPDNYTVPLAITSFVGKSGSAFQMPWGEIMAATVIVTLPLIVLTLIAAEAHPRRPDRRRRQGLTGTAASASLVSGSKKYRRLVSTASSIGCPRRFASEG